MAEWSELVGFFLLGSSLMVTFVGIPFGWAEWRGELKQAGRPTVRALVSATIFGVTLEMLLFMALWTPFIRSNAFPRPWLLVEAVMFPGVLACSFAWKGKARWWLRAASVLIPLLSFLVLVAGAAE
jgi:hypothetical protein